MHRVGVICFVHQDSSRIMVYSDCDRSAGSQFDSCACPAASGEVIYNYLVEEINLPFHLFLRFIQEGRGFIGNMQEEGQRVL